MRKLVIAILWLLVILFPPYWESGLFDDDIGWIFLFDDYSYFTPVLSGNFFFEYFSWSIFFVEVIALSVLNAVWKKGEAGELAVPAQSPAAPVAPQPKPDITGELGKLNDLRLAGALSEEEFAEQKARLLGGGIGEGVLSAAVGTGAYNFPTSKIANAYAHLREKGLDDRMIVGAAHTFLWQRGKPMPPGPYMTEEAGLFLALTAMMGLAFGVLMTLFFNLFIGPAGLGVFLFLSVGFGGAMYLASQWYFRKLIRDRGLSRWEEIPG